MSDAASKIAFQGVPGAYSHMACQAIKPEMEPVSCSSFEDMLMQVQTGEAGLAMVPVENSIAGRVADIHNLLPSSGLHIIGEHFHRVNHHILAPRGATLDGLSEVHSHAQGLAQCRNRIRSLGLTPVMHPDTAGAAKDIAALGDPKIGAIASRLAAKIYDLDVLFESAEDDAHNTTRFLIMASTPEVPPQCGDDHHIGLPTPQCTGCPLQGTWWFCDQRDQFDQAGILYPSGCCQIGPVLHGCTRSY